MLVYLALVYGNLPLPVLALSAALTVIVANLLFPLLLFLTGSLTSDIEHRLSADSGRVALVSNEASTSAASC